MNSCKLLSKTFSGKNVCKRNLYLTSKIFLDKSDESKDEKSSGQEEDCDITDEPTNCCMSGCVNCVWIQYAEKLSQTLNASDADVQKIIIDKIQDPNMKAFLLMELRCRNLIK